MSDKTRPTKIITTSGRDVGNFPTRQEAEDWLTSQNITPVFREPELAELVVTGKRPQSIWKQGAENFEQTFGISPKEVAGFIPYVGDAIDLGDIGTDLYKGNYKDAAIGAGLFLLPNILEKPAKYLYKGVKKAIKSARDYRIGRELNSIPLSQSRVKAPTSTTISYTPSNRSTERARLDFFERGPANISEAERAGIPKGERNQPMNPPINPVEEFKARYGTTPGNPSYPTSISEVIPNQLPRENFRDNPAFSYEAPYNNWEESLLFGDPNNSVANLKEYIATLPKSDPIDFSTIRDYRTYLSRVGVNPYALTDEEISALITNQYNILSSEMTGKLKGVPMYHGSYTPVERFNFQRETGKGLGNMGASGPGNYFSTGRHNYGQIKVYDENVGKSYVIGDMQPYLINNVKSTPVSATLQRKGILPKYQSPPEGIQKAQQAKALLIQNESGHYPITKDKIAELKQIVSDYENSPGYQAYISQNITPYTQERNMFIIDSDAMTAPFHLGQSVFPLANGKEVFSIEGMIPRNTGIKSLFPHPSTLVKDANGNWVIKRDWLDPRVNYKKGGKLKCRRLKNI